jgi:uncharacterized repeat protein (TIGR01451 family)
MPARWRDAFPSIKDSAVVSRTDVSMFLAPDCKQRGHRRTRARIVAGLAGLALCCVVAVASAQVVLESVTNTAVAGSGPAGNGPDANPQVVTLRHNSDNPGGNAMTARTPAVTATFSLTNHQFSGLTAAQGYPASTGGNAVFFGGAPATTGNAPASLAIYQAMSAFGIPAATHFTSVNPVAGQGISLSANAGIELALSTRAIEVRAPATPLNARVRLADLVITFNVPVDNPILHFTGMGGLGNAAPAQPQLGISGEFDLVTTTGQTLTRVSGNTHFVVSGTQINNGSARMGSGCTAGGDACGSVRVNGTRITSITLRTYVRGDGTSGAQWNGQANAFTLDGLSIGVSVNEPAPTFTVRKASFGGTGIFNFTGTNGYTDTTVITNSAGTVETGTTRTLAAANSATTITEATTAGYRLMLITCSGLGAGGTATPTVPAAGVAGGGSVLLSASAVSMGSDIACIFTNERLPILRVRKALPLGRAQPGHQFRLTIQQSGTTHADVTTTGSSDTPAEQASYVAASGVTYTLSESATDAAAQAFYSPTYACTNSRVGGQTPSGNGTTFTVTPVAGDDLTCTFTNNVIPTEVSVQKAASAATVTRGQNVQFTLLVRNTGTIAADGTRIVDPAVAGLNCSALSCTAAGSAQCPASPTVGGLQTAPGLAIPALPGGGSVSLLLTCTVTATGFAP